MTPQSNHLDGVVENRRLMIICFSSCAAIGAFFALAIAVSRMEEKSLQFLPALAFVGFIPAWRGWSGWVSKWKALVFGLLVPVAVAVGLMVVIAAISSTAVHMK